MISVKTLPPLNVTCTSTACVIGQHYYGPKRRKQSAYPVGTCRACGIELVDWDRIHGRRFGDADYTIQMLETECWRHQWWHSSFDAEALRHAGRKGKTNLARDIDKRLRTKGFCSKGVFDGRQTPKSGNVLFYAQHATATCCRGCIQYWHGIPADRAFTDSERQYLASLVMRFIDLRLPDLPEEAGVGQSVTRPSNGAPQS